MMTTKMPMRPWTPLAGRCEANRIYIPEEELRTHLDHLTDMERSRPYVRPPTGEEVRVHAYFLWQRAGRPEGHDWHFWFVAERQLEALRG